jgi:phosphoglycerate dehydrogenase-like enzyme
MSEQIQVLITLPLNEELKAELEEVSERLSITHLPTRQGSPIPEEVWEKTEVLYTMRTLPENKEAAPNLKWVQCFFAGVDALVDAPIFKKKEENDEKETKKIILTSMSGANASQVAEHVMMMMMALGHSVPDFLSLQSRNEWMTDKAARYQPQELRDSTVGIVGYGSVGRQIARLAQAMGANVLATKKDLMHPEDTGYSPQDIGDPEGDFFTRLYPPEAIRSMFKECDFVVITIPLNKDTKDLIGAGQLAALKPSAFLVDVSRGGIVNHKSLIQALKDNRLAGAAIDVFPEEPLPADSPLWAMSNVILTPHIAGFSPFYDQRALALFIENLNRYLDKEPLLNQVDLDRGY